MWVAQNRHTGDRLRLFTAVADTVAAETVLYPGSFVAIAPSFVFPAVTYLDEDKRAARFFADSEGVEATSPKTGPMLQASPCTSYMTTTGATSDLSHRPSTCSCLSAPASSPSNAPTISGSGGVAGERQPRRRKDGLDRSASPVERGRDVQVR
jgi:hypothetical protein